jgi:hypothetical protein
MPAPKAICLLGVSAALDAGSPEQMDEAIQALERRINLYEIVLARILG